MLINASIEVRMTSRRLPGKVLMPVKGKPVLELLIERVKRSGYIDKIIVATTTNTEDDPVEKLSLELGVDCFRGSEEDVLERVYHAHKKFHSDIVVELTGDNPLIDPSLIDYSVLSYLYSDCDCVSTALDPFFPKGQAVEVFSFELLEYLDQHALTPYDREHVTPHIFENKDKFKVLALTGSEHHRAPQQIHTLDTKDDYDRVQKVFNSLYDEDPDFNMSQAIAILK